LGGDGSKPEKKLHGMGTQIGEDYAMYFDKANQKGGGLGGGGELGTRNSCGKKKNKGFTDKRGVTEYGPE